MKGYKNNTVKVKTNIVQMPAGMFALHSVVMLFAGYEFCKHEKLYLRSVGLKGKEEKDDTDDRTDEEQGH